MVNIIKISNQTMKNYLLHKSTYVLYGLLLLLLYLITSSFKFEETTWKYLKFLTHFNSFMNYLIVGLIAAKLLSKDKKDGGIILYLSRCVTRYEYFFGRILGIWIASVILLSLTNIFLYILILIKAKLVFNIFIISIFFISLNIAFVICLVSVITIYLNDIIAFFVSLIIVCLGIFLDGIQLLKETNLFKTVIKGVDVQEWAILPKLYPKLFYLQAKVVILLKEDTLGEVIFSSFNLFVYCLIFLLFGVRRISSKEIF